VERWFESLFQSTVDGVSLSYIAETYFSLTKEASVLTPIDFKGGLVAPNARIGSLKVNGLVNGKDLTTFAGAVLRDGEFQEITGLYTFDAFHTSCKSWDSDKFYRSPFHNSFSHAQLINYRDLCCGSNNLIYLNQSNCARTSTKNYSEKNLSSWSG